MAVWKQALPSTGAPPCSTDRHLLLLKATAQSTLASLDQCLAILQQQSSQLAAASHLNGFQQEYLIPKPLYVPSRCVYLLH